MVHGDGGLTAGAEAEETNPGPAPSKAAGLAGSGPVYGTF